MLMIIVPCPPPKMTFCTLPPLQGVGGLLGELDLETERLRAAINNPTDPGKPRGPGTLKGGQLPRRASPAARAGGQGHVRWSPGDNWPHPPAMRFSSLPCQKSSWPSACPAAHASPPTLPPSTRPFHPPLTDYFLGGLTPASLGGGPGGSLGARAGGSKRTASGLLRRDSEGGPAGSERRASTGGRRLADLHEARAQINVLKRDRVEAKHGSCWSRSCAASDATQAATRPASAQLAPLTVAPPPHTHTQGLPYEDGAPELAGGLPAVGEDEPFMEEEQGRGQGGKGGHDAKHARLGGLAQGSGDDGGAVQACLRGCRWGWRRPVLAIAPQSRVALTCRPHPPKKITGRCRHIRHAVAGAHLGVLGLPRLPAPCSVLNPSLPAYFSSGVELQCCLLCPAACASPPPQTHTQTE